MAAAYDRDDAHCCSICLEIYDEDNHKPKFLSCHHTLCILCIETIIATSSRRDHVVCPHCRKRTYAKRANDLQTNFYISSKKARPSGCEVHSDQPLSFYCQTCLELICRDCTVLAHNKDHGHQILEVYAMKDTCMDYLREIQDNLVKSKNQLLKEKFKLTNALVTMGKSKTNAEREIHTVFDDLIRQLEKQKQSKLNQLEESFAARRDGLSRKEGSLADDINDVNKYLTEIKLLEAESQHELSTSKFNTKAIKAYQQYQAKALKKEETVECIDQDSSSFSRTRNASYLGTCTCQSSPGSLTSEAQGINNDCVTCVTRSAKDKQVTQTSRPERPDKIKQGAQHHQTSHVEDEDLQYIPWFSFCRTPKQVTLQNIGEIKNMQIDPDLISIQFLTIFEEGDAMIGKDVILLTEIPSTLEMVLNSEHDHFEFNVLDQQGTTIKSEFTGIGENRFRAVFTPKESQQDELYKCSITLFGVLMKHRFIKVFHHGSNEAAIQSIFRKVEFVEDFDEFEAY